ncbi:MAG: hypothetical protein JW709_04160 [Sedimentisphaerales bacterium]|nr:hypothetical protein [Sedimentisphaerales bacterium]
MFTNIRNLHRYRQIITTVGRFGFGELFGRWGLRRRLRLRKATTEQTPHQNRAVRVRLMLEQLGPTFIKLGQVLSTRPDVLPADIVSELANLQDSVTPIDWPRFRAGLDASSLAILDSLADFNTKPIASASIAQVYEARLKSNERIAVKIVRPSARRIIRDDLLILEHIGRLIQTHVEEARDWNIPGLIEQFRTSITHELDLQHEGRNADIFRSNFAGDDTIAVPRVYWDYTNRDILVMEFINGRRIAEFFTPGADLAYRKKLAETGAKAVLKQIFEHGFFQADPHPGNAFVLDGGVICFLDFGMFGRLESHSLDILAGALHAIVNKDVDRLLRAARDMGILDHTQVEPSFRLAVLDMLEQYHGLPLKQIHVPYLLRDIITLMNRYRLGVRPDIIFMIKALGTIEATGRKLDPDFDMISHIAPFVRTLMLKRFRPETMLASTRDFLEDLGRLTRESPELVLDILRRTSAGKLQVEMKHTRLEESMTRLNQMSDKVTLGIIIGALIIASALMAHVGIGPKLFGFPIIGGFGFLVAGITGLWITYDILRNRRR